MRACIYVLLDEMGMLLLAGWVMVVVVISLFFFFSSSTWSSSTPGESERELIERGRLCSPVSAAVDAETACIYARRRVFTSNHVCTRTFSPLPPLPHFPSFFPQPAHVDEDAKEGAPPSTVEDGIGEAEIPAPAPASSSGSPAARRFQQEFHVLACRVSASGEHVWSLVVENNGQVNF